MINLTREEAQQVLDALVFATPSGFGPAEVYKDAVVLLQNLLEKPDSKAHLQFSGPMHVVCKCDKCVEQPEPEPLGWIVMHEGMNIDELRIHEVEQIGYDEKPMPNQYRVYTAPPQREWVGLTDDEYELMAEKRVTNYFFNTLDYAHDIEAMLKEKNGG